MEVKQNESSNQWGSLIVRFESGGEKENFAENLAMLLSSGMDAISALSAMKKETKSAGMKRLIDGIEADIAGGTSLSAALERSGLFSKHIMALIKTGEESGRLVPNLKVVVTELTKERAFRTKVASAMMYPVFVLFLTITIGTGLAWFVLPKLAQVFSTLRLSLPWITRTMIAVGEFLGKNGTWFVPSVIVVLTVLVYFLFINRKTNFLGQRLLFGLPGVRRLMSEVELARFGYILGNLLAAGLPVVDALDSLAGVSTLEPYKKLYLHLREEVEKGSTFQHSFALYLGIEDLVPITIQQMIITAEQSGYLADTLIKIGERYEEKTDLTTKNLGVILEPILLVIVALGVFGVAVAVILPIYSLVGGLTSGQQTSLTISPTVIVTQMATPTPTPANKQIVVNQTDIGYLNIRQSPALTAPIIGRALPGDKYQWIDKQGEWYEINLPEGGKGWVNGAYVTQQ